MPLPFKQKIEINCTDLKHPCSEKEHSTAYRIREEGELENNYNFWSSLTKEKM